MAKANAFYVCAENQRTGNSPMAAFMLHQATELTLRALTKTLTGQERTTHSIKHLLLFSLRITTKLSLLIDNQEPEDERLLAVLEAAYLGFRYSDYTINETDLDTWFERIHTLQSHTHEIFSAWMTQYDSLIKTIQNG